MTHGKNICNQLKEVRKRIAEENVIPLEVEECTYKGECRGTCPRCEAEVRYLENALADRQKRGKAIKVAGVAMMLVAGGSASAQVEPVQLTPHISVTPSDTTEADYAEEILVGCISEPDPEFPGGYEALLKFLSENIHYPEEAKKEGIEGRVYVTFVVEKDGSISGVRVLRDIGGGCGEEAVRVVETMPKWKPGLQRGVPVRVQFNLPVNFKLPVEDKKDDMR